MENIDKKLEILNKTLGNIEKQHGKGAAMIMGDKPIENIESISTGSYLLDDALGIGGIPKGRIIEVYGPESSGKCLTGDSKILTPFGYREVFELFDYMEENSDFKNYRDKLDTPTEIPFAYPLINKDGVVEYTTHFTINGYKDVRAITTENNVVIKGTHNHPLLVLSNGVPVWKKIKDLKTGDHLIRGNTSFDLNNNFNKNLHLDGVLLAKYLMGEEIDELKDLFFYDKIKPKDDSKKTLFEIKKSYPATHMDIIDKEFNRIIERDFGNFNAFIRTLTDDFKKDIIDYKDWCVSYSLIEKIQLYLLDLDIQSRIYIKSQTITIGRKIEYNGDYKTEEIVDIYEIKQVPTFDFAMEDTHTFVAQGIINHNTTLALHTIAEIQKEGGIAAMIDAEHALDPKYAANLGVDVDRMVLAQPDTGEQGLEIAESLARSGVVDLIVIDSVAALVPKAEIEGEMGDSHMGLQARLMSQALRKIAGVVNKTNTTVLFINQVRENIGVMWGPKETTPGGRALKFYSSVRMEIRRVGQIKEGDQVIGNETRVKVVKNKVSAPFKEVRFNIMYGEGIDSLNELIDMSIEKDIIDKAGSWLTYESLDGESIKVQGALNFKNTLKDRPEIIEEIEERLFNNISSIDTTSKDDDVKLKIDLEE